MATTDIIDPLKQNEKLGAGVPGASAGVAPPPLVSAQTSPLSSGIGGTRAQNAGSMGADTITGDFSGIDRSKTLREQNAMREPGGFSSGFEQPKPAISAPPAPIGAQPQESVPTQAKPIVPSDIPSAAGKVDTSKLSPEQSAYYNANKTYIDALAAKTGMEQEQAKLATEAAIGAETKYGKDIAEAQSDTQKAYDLAKKTAEIQNSAQLQSAKDSLDKLNRNIQYFAGAAGFPQTEQGMKAQHEQLLRATDLVNRMQSLNDLQMQGMSDDLAKNMRELQQQLDSNVSKAVQEALVNVGTLKSMGKLDSVEAINKARADLRDTLNTKYNDFLKNTFEMSKLSMERAEKGLEAYQKTKEFSPDFTKQMNDGYIYSANGTKMTDAMGQPLKATQSKDIKTVIDNKDGTQTVLYADGQYEQIKAGQDTSKAVDEGVTKLLGPTTGFVYNSQGNIITGADGQPLKYTPESQKNQVVTLKDEFGNERAYIFDGTNLKPYDIQGQWQPGVTPSTDGGTGTKYSPGTNDFTSLAPKYPNVAAFKNNNPAGITWNANFEAGDKGTAKLLSDAGIIYDKGTSRPSSEGGNYVKFASIEDGLAAQRIMMEKTYGNVSVRDMLAKWVGTSEGPQYAMTVAASAGIDPKMTVASLSENQLDALQIAKLKRESPGLLGELANAGIVEGNSINFSKKPFDTAETNPVAAEFMQNLKSGNFTVTGSEKPIKTYSATDRTLFDKVLGGKETAEDKKEIRRKGYTNADIDAYAESIPPSTELSDKKFTQMNQILSKFVANPQVKAFETALDSGGDLIASLNSANGPGDIGAVFQFMKTLDPTSTVREGEFALAAKSAGVWEQFKNIPANKIEGTVLTDEQRKAFGKLAFQYINNKAKTYDTKYDDMKRVFEAQGIPDTYLPTKMSDQIEEYAGGETIVGPSGNSYNINDFR